jgi:hypothetical protein
MGRRTARVNPAVRVLPSRTDLVVNDVNSWLGGEVTRVGPRGLPPVPRQPSQRPRSREPVGDEAQRDQTGRRRVTASPPDRACSSGQAVRRDRVCPRSPGNSGDDGEAGGRTHVLGLLDGSDTRNLAAGLRLACRALLLAEARMRPDGAWAKRGLSTGQQGPEAATKGLSARSSSA